MILLDAASPNFDSRQGAPVSILVLHYTGMPDTAAALHRLRDPASKVSAHYLVEETGTTYQLVEESERAWHAGVSSWRGITDVNAHSIGIEIANPGHEFGYPEFPAPQMKSVMELCKEILARHSTIEARNVVGHSDVAPERKQDPGEKFNWKRLANAGIGLWPDIAGKVTDYGDNMREIQRKLQQYGYGVELTGMLDEKTRAVITAFQRHFRPKYISGAWDGECDALLVNLLVQLS